MDQRKTLSELFPGVEPKKIDPMDPVTLAILRKYSADYELALAKGEEYRRTCEDRFGLCAA